MVSLIVPWTSPSPLLCGVPLDTLKNNKGKTVAQVAYSVHVAR